MGLPSITVTFKDQASTFIQRSKKGVVGVIVKDAGVTAGGYVLSSVADIPAGLGGANKSYIEHVFLGNADVPQKVIVYVLGVSAEDYEDALHYFETVNFDYLVGAPDIDAELCADVKAWVLAQRALGRPAKAVLPEYAADHEAIINFAAEDIKAGGAVYDAGEYCSRIAGLIVGTPAAQSVTYAVLPEVESVKKLTKTELDQAIDAGKLVLFSDGEKVKVARGVTSMTTTSNKIAAMKKIKIVETADMILRDIRSACEDTYIGKMPNSYDNKCVLMAAIKNYLTALEDEGILEAGTSVVEIDLEAQRAYLLSKGVDVSDLTTQQIKEYNTDEKVFLAATVRMLDAIEDISLSITM